MHVGLKNIFWLNVPRNCDDPQLVVICVMVIRDLVFSAADGVRLVRFFEDFSYLSTCLVAVHMRHTAVRKDQGVPLFVIFFNCFTHEFDCLLPIIAHVHVRKIKLHAEDAHEPLNGVNVEDFIVDNHDSLRTFNIARLSYYGVVKNHSRGWVVMDDEFLSNYLFRYSF